MASPLKSIVDPKEQLFDLRRNFGEYMLQHLRHHARSKWINGTSDEAVTYGEVAEQVEAVRAALWRLGLQAGDRILLLSGRRLQLLPAFLGAASAGVASMYMSPGYGVDILADAMRPLSLVALFCEPCWVQDALKLQRELPSIKTIIVLDELADKPDDASNCVITWSELLKKGRILNGTPCPSIEYREKQICYMTSTSGTTGKAKVVVHYHESLLAVVQANSHPAHMNLSTDDVALCTTSLGHVYALFDVVCKAIVQGASVAFVESADDVLEALHTHKVRDVETENPLGPWEQGELVVRSPGLMCGYWGRLNESVTDSEGWYRTGDLCYYDEDGWLYLVQRLSDFFCCRGTKVSPVLVETVLQKCPEVHDCAVVGLPHHEAGHVAHAVVVRKPEARTLGVEHFTRFMEANAPKSFKLEGGATFVDKIPRNELGKLVRRELIQWVLKQQEQAV
ncbi:luciferin 4-monooxygenase-like isoform X3 [Dermacentor variabilis]|uniref:luciferin 4-monooxygenase-like isoform X3 n=1 Tax=Dermacentor variabilis TaxID=34621 RepID=UPI003F5C1DE2